MTVCAEENPQGSAAGVMSIDITCAVTGFGDGDELLGRRAGCIVFNRESYRDKVVFFTVDKEHRAAIRLKSSDSGIIPEAEPREGLRKEFGDVQ